MGVVQQVVYFPLFFFFFLLFLKKKPLQGTDFHAPNSLEGRVVYMQFQQFSPRGNYK